MAEKPSVLMAWAKNWSILGRPFRAMAAGMGVGMGSSGLIIVLTGQPIGWLFVIIGGFTSLAVYTTR